MTAKLKSTDPFRPTSRAWHFTKGLVVAGYLLSAGLSQANSTEIQCADVQTLANLAQQNFVKSTDQSVELPRLGADECSIALGKAGTQIYFCSWGFDYRSGEARRYFGELERDIITCLNPQSPPKDDQRVNHPDSFTQQTYSVNGADISISVKDKSPLQKTFVFFRMQRTGSSGQ